MGIVKGIPRGQQQNFSGVIINFSIDEGTKGRIIPFVFSPEALSDSVQASFSQTTIPGASAPQITYTATGARTVSMSLILPLDYLPPNSPYTNFEDYLNSFRALAYPKYQQSGKVESPHCKLTTSNLEIDGVCTQCSIDYKTDRYASDGSVSATVSLNFLEVLDNVGKVDAKWIANSKVNILKNTSVTTRAGSSGNNSQTYYSTADDGKCNITLLGQGQYTVYSPTNSLYETINKGLWREPGYSYTKKDRYTVTKYYGNTFGSEIPSISDININLNSNGVSTGCTCICNGKSVSLSSSPTNSDNFTGEDMMYFIIYIPVYDVNKFDVDSSKLRFVRIIKEAR